MKEKSKQLQTFILSLMMLIMGTAGAWGDTETWTTSKDASLTRTHFTVALGGKATQLASGSGNRIRFPKDGDGNSTMTISTNSGETLDGITIDWKSTPNSSPTTATVTSGTWSTTSKNYDTWTKTGTTGPTTVTFTFQDSKDVEIQGITVTYTTGGGSTPTTTTLTVDPDEGSVYVGKTLDIHGYVDTNSNATVTYTSNDDDVATVTSAGVISGVAAGSTTITVSQAANASYTAANETFTITVNDAPTQYTITLAANDNDMGYVTAIYNVADDYNDKAVNDEFTSGTKVSSGTRLTITAHPNTGYEFNETANPYVDGGVTKYRPWGNATGSTTATFTTATLDTGDKTYTAHFKAKTYTITLDGNGATTAGSANTTATYDSSTLTAITAPTKTDYNLTGYWTSTSGGEMIIDAGGELQASTTYTDGSGNWKHDGVVTLHAQWESAAAPTYSVTYHNNLDGASGSVTDASTYEAGASVPTQANSYSKSGYTFLGWSTSSGYQSSYTTAGNNVTMVAGGLDLYAQWQIDGSISSSPASGSSVVSGQAVTTTATSTAATGIKYNQGASEYTVAQLIASGGSVDSKTLNWTLSQNAIGAQVFSAVLTDGTFYSAVLTQNYTIGVAAPVISCSSNTVTITCATTGATIYYTSTTDGTEPADPTSSSTAYSTPLSINRDTKVKAIAIKNETSSAVTEQECVYASAVTTLPVTFDFTNTTYWPTSTDFNGANQANLSIIDSSNNHEIVFHGTSATEFDIDGSGLEIGQNGATNHFIAIPISGINGRIDIDVWAPYSSSSTFKIRGKLDTANTTAQTSAGSLNTLNVNKYEGGHFNFRIKDISATEGVLYIGRNGSSYPCIEKIRITTAAANLVPDKASVTMSDAAEPDTVTITNNTVYNVLVKTVPSYVTVTFDPSTGKLVVTPIAAGSEGNIELCVDTNGDGDAGDADLSIPVTVTGISISEQPSSHVYATGASATNALSVTASFSGSGSLSHQWYKNTVNSTAGGEAISGATSSTYTPSTSATEESAFYYCVLSATGYKTQTTDVVYVLTSSSKRYFHMSNVAGNRQTSDASEKITGEIVAGGTATAIYGSGTYYRYVNRPSTSYPHMYHVLNAGNYIQIDLDKAVSTNDIVSVRLMGNDSNGGIIVSDGTNNLELAHTSAAEETIVRQFTSGFNGKTTLFIKGRTGSAIHYFTDLTISEQAPLAISDPNPSSQSVEQEATPTTLTVAASGGSGNYSYQWYQDTSSSGTFTTEVTSGTGYDTASFTPSTASTGTMYYKCKVTDTSTNTNVMSSSYATVTVTEQTHTYYKVTSDGQEFALTAANYGTPGTTQKYWLVTSGTASFDGTNGAKLDADNDDWIHSFTFYVSGARSFELYTNKSSRAFNVTIDGGSAISLVGNTTDKVALNPDGCLITVYAPGDNGDIKLSKFKFDKNTETVITVSKYGETVAKDSIYVGGGDQEYVITTNNSGGTITASSSKNAVATVSYDGGTLTVTPVADGKATITISQTADGDYNAGSTTLEITVKKHTLKLAFSYEKATFKASSLTENNQWNTGSLPVLTATLDGEDVSLASYTIHYETDEKNVAYFGASQPTSSLRNTYEELSDGSSYRIRWGGSQGGARIYAYVTNPGANVSSEVVYFDLVVEAGTSNNLPKGTHPTEQDQFELQNSEGVTVVTLTYGGYKYKKENGWSAASAKGTYYIDGYANYTRHDLDSYDEYGYQLKGMSDEATGPTTSSDAKAKYSFNTWSSQNVGAHKFWYTTSETKPVGGGSYSEYERIRPFTLPCRGGYLKFEPKQTGKLTVYVWQNGVIGRGSHSNQIGSKPRLGYWFDAEGWVQTPSVDPVSKQPISNANGRDTHSYKCEDNTSRKLDGQMDYYWTAANGDDAIIPALRNKYCNNAENPTSFNNTSGALNPYYWPDSTEVVENNKLMIPKKMKPYKYHNGYFVPEDSYVKYVLNVVAGKTYYFQGMMTKIGYVGMNFVEDESVFGASFGHNESLHLNATDDMATVVSGQTKDITVYDEVTLPSNYKKGQWSTICLPFALSENQVEEAFGKGTQLTLYNGAIKKSEGIYTVKYLSHVDRNILPGQAYFIKPTGVDANGDDLPNVGGKIGGAVEGQSGTRITFNTVCIDKTNFSTETSYGNNTDVDQGGSSIGQEGYVFVGAYNNETLPKYSYIVSGGLLRQFTGSTAKIPTYYAYLKPHTSAASNGSYSLGVDFNEENVENAWVADSEDEPTGVISMEAIADAMNNGKVLSGKAYNMMGQEVDPRSAKGMVIINGKKIMK